MSKLDFTLDVLSNLSDGTKTVKAVNLEVLT